MGAQPNGVWTYVGYNQTSPTGPWNNVPSDPLVTTPIGGTMVGDNPLVNPLGKSAGFYRFRYYIDDGVCNDEAFATIEIGVKTCAGANKSKTVCVGSPVNIIEELQSNANCSITLGTVTPSFPNNIFTPTAPGTYTFVHQATLQPEPGFNVICNQGCNSTATLTLTVVPYSAASTPKYPLLSTCVGCSSFTLADALNNVPGFTGVGKLYHHSGNPVVIGGVLRNPGDLITETTSTNQSISLQSNSPTKVFQLRYVTNEGLPCEESTIFTVGFYPALNAGTSSELAVCTSSSGGLRYLHNELGNNLTSGGTWTYTTENIPNLVSPQQQEVLNNVVYPSLSITGDQRILNLAYVFPRVMNYQTVLTAIRLNFTYTVSNPGTAICAACQPKSATRSYLVRIRPHAYSLYPQSAPYQYVKNNSSPGTTLFSLNTLFNEFGYMQSQFSPLISNTIQNLIVFDSLYDTPGVPGPQTTFNSGAIIHPASDYVKGVNLDFVPPGLYMFQMVFSNPNPLLCPAEPEPAWIQVLDPEPSCNVDVTIST